MFWLLSRLPHNKKSASLRRAEARANRSAERRRRPGVEQLECRTLLAALPYGAMPDDTAEYMLGDVYVSVVLMESNASLSPGDNNPVPQGIGAPAENWATNAIDTIAAVKSRIEQGLQWWEDTLDSVLEGTPAEGRDLLNFTIDWTHADNPVQTGYEPIARNSNDFVLWMYDFLNLVGFNQTGNFSSDIRAYNDFKRQQNGVDWAFTIFVVNNEMDQDKIFAPGGSFSKAFSFAGGRMMVVPADRPASTFAHEAAHMFWALDEYAGTTANYLSRRGYYNTQNTNHASNPGPDFVQQNSIMAADPALTAAWLSNDSSTSSLEMIGWKDSDDDGLFDVLDVPFTLDGIGYYDPANEEYLFAGSSAVRTFPNQNSSGLQNDITINQIREVQYSIDGGDWIVAQTLPSRTYETPLDLAIPLSPGEHVIKIRTVDTRTGAMSPEFIGTTGEPSQTPTYGGISGFVYEDSNANGEWDQDEPPLPDWALDLVSETGEELVLSRRIEPSQFAEATLLNNVHTEVVLTSFGTDAASNEVRARTTSKAPGAGRVFANSSVTLGPNNDTWSATRQLRINFNVPASSVNIRAYAAGSAASFGRLEIYNSSGELLDRYTTSQLSSGGFELMSLKRAEGDIAYAIARGHAGTQVVLDTLQWGTAASATTNALGAYSLAALPAGDYHVRVNPPPNHTVTTYPTGIATLTLGIAQALTGINFGIAFGANPWHNFASNLNVNADPDGVISPVDALMVINWLNSHSTAQLPGQATPQIHGFVDVNNDSLCTPIDALLVINWLNSEQNVPPPAEGEGSAPAFAPAGNLPAAGNSPAEGETSPQTVAEYFAKNPLHFLEIAGDDDLCVHDEHSDLGPTFQAAASQVVPALASTGPISRASSLSGAPLLLAGGSSEIGQRLSTIGQELHDRLEQQLGDSLPRHTLQPVLDRVQGAKETLAVVGDELDEALEAIAPDVSHQWQAALERILRRFPHGLG